MITQNILVTVSYKAKDKDSKSSCDTKVTYIDSESSNRHLMVGGMVTKDFGSFTFQVKNLDEARRVPYTNPLLKSRLNRFKDITYNFEILG